MSNQDLSPQEAELHARAVPLDEEPAAEETPQAEAAPEPEASAAEEPKEEVQSDHLVALARKDNMNRKLQKQLEELQSNQSRLEQQLNEREAAIREAEEQLLRDPVSYLNSKTGSTKWFEDAAFSILGDEEQRNAPVSREEAMKLVEERAQEIAKSQLDEYVAAQKAAQEEAAQKAQQEQLTQAEQQVHDEYDYSIGKHFYDNRDSFPATAKLFDIYGEEFVGGKMTQWKDSWINERLESAAEYLGRDLTLEDKKILFGEWTPENILVELEAKATEEVEKLRKGFAPSDEPKRSSEKSSGPKVTTVNSDLTGNLAPDANDDEEFDTLSRHERIARAIKRAGVST